MPAFSIITVTWNNLEGLRTTAKSVQRQSCRDFEWIIMDGASSDGTVDAAGRAEFEGARFFSEPDKGLYDAMNKGIDRATGDYLIFMNGGDAFADEKVLEDVAALPGFGSAEMIYGDAFEVEGEKRIFKSAFHHRTAPYTMFTHHQAIFYRRADVGDLRYDMSYRIGADWVFTGEVLRRIDNPLRIRRAICNFERGGLSQGGSSEFVREAYDERRRAMREVFHVPGPIIPGLIGLRHGVNAMRGRFPGLYDRIRSMVRT